MVHGGMIDPATLQLRTSASLVVLTDADFMKGYQRGQQEQRQVTDTLFMEAINGYATARLPIQTLSYELGRWAGNLSVALLPGTILETVS